MDRRGFLKRSALALAAGALPAHSVTAAPSPAYVGVRVRGGRIVGTREQGVCVFRGIRYAADTAPVRFRPALREDGWRGVCEAFAYGASAMQAGRDGPGSEDCLFLNVWTPGVRDGGQRPILVYIHGGAYSTGSGSEPLYDGTRLCVRGDVVVITLNHRLNALGYLQLPARAGSAFAQAGNVGQLDLVQALQWVREHAAEFGGNAHNVTLFGQSGGGAKIATLMAMPAAQGLFQRAWTMSGQQVTAAGPRSAKQRAQVYMDALGVSDVEALLRVPVAALVDALATRDPSQVEDAALYFGPVLDGVVLPRHPFWPDAPAQSAEIPMVIGNTRDETRAFLGNDPANFMLTWDTLPERLGQQQFVDIDPVGVIAHYRKLYPAYSPSEVFFAATTAGRSWRGALEELQMRAQQGSATWAYQLDWYPQDIDGGTRRRAFHTLDIPLVFDNILQPGALTGTSAAAQSVADAMSAALLAFARRGDPRTEATAAWEPYAPPQRATMVFAGTPELQHDPRAGERKLYSRVPFIQRGTF